MWETVRTAGVIASIFGIGFSAYSAIRREVIESENRLRGDISVLRTELHQTEVEQSHKIEAMRDDWHRNIKELSDRIASLAA